MIYDPKLPSWVKIHFSLFESLYTYKFMCVYVCGCVCVCVCVCMCVCVCFIHFRLFPFPTKKKNPTARDAWREIINRNVNLKGCKIWEQSKDSRVC